MELVLFRTYYTDGTNGTLYINDSLQCYTIELPWVDNLPRVSCIPEGRYELKKRYSPKFKDHLLVKGVPGRSLVLLHPANDALKELKGCIAPVSSLDGEGKGTDSRKAFKKLLQLVYEALEMELVFLTIQCKDDEHSTAHTVAHT
ncbi:MAG TPA: DUF5675 family protein [Flavisolibacter sp.]|nr:DUF5675 family protein [Flavisolibacter sp.]